eukprot:988008_1
MPAEIINNRLYVFGGQDEDTNVNQIPLSSIEVCAIPVSPTNTPSKYPSKRPSASPVHNSSVSPSQQLSNRPTSSKLTSTADVTRALSSVGSTYSMDSAEDMAGVSNLFLM